MAYHDFYLKNIHIFYIIFISKNHQPIVVHCWTSCWIVIIVDSILIEASSGRKSGILYEAIQTSPKADFVLAPTINVEYLPALYA